MLTLGPGGIALLATIAALWLAAAIIAIVIAQRRVSAANAALASHAGQAALIAAAPVASLIVDSGDRVDADPRIALWLGCADLPETLDDLAGPEGLASADLATLRADIALVFASGGRFDRKLVAGGRLFRLTGQPRAAPAGEPRSVLLWFADVTDEERAGRQLAAEVDRLRRALDGLAALIEAAPFPMWHRGPDLRLVLVNSAYVRAVEGKDAADVIGRNMELAEADEGHTPRSVAADARDAGVISSRVAPAIIDGQRRMMRIVDVPLGEAGIAGYAVDVQEVAEARGELGLFARAQRDMLDRLSAGVVQFAADHSLSFFNRHFARLFGIDPEWLGDRPEFDRLLEKMRDVQRAPESRDFPGWKAGRRAWFQATEAIEENWLLPGGTHLRVVAQPLPDRGLVLIFEDRTEHLQLASARDTLLRVRAATFDNLFEAIGVFASDGRLHLWNNRFREVWDLTEEELVRHPRVDALVQTIAPKLLDPTRAGLVRDLVRIATVERQQRSGRISLLDGRHFEFAAVPLPDGNALFTLLDVTASRGIEAALRDRNEALEEANSLKNAFVASMSYELRVPLTSIAGFAEMLAGGYAGVLEPTAREYVEAIMSAVARLGALIGDVLDLTQSEAGSLPMTMAPVDVGGLAADAIRHGLEQARNRGLTLASDVPAEVGAVLGDRQRLLQCLDHIVRNAVAYTPVGGRILLRARTVDDHVEMIVSDNGPGIPASQRERIFDRFGRASIGHQTERREGQALGIGLPLARQLIEAHGGTLTLISEVGQGTSVILRLPSVAAA